MRTIREQENIFQTFFLATILLAKRFYGELLGEWENLAFIFGAALGLYLIHSLCVRYGKDYPNVDDWEERFNLGTLALYGVAAFVLQLMGATNLLFFAAVGLILVAINVLVKLKRKQAIRNYRK